MKLIEIKKQILELGVGNYLASILSFNQNLIFSKKNIFLSKISEVRKFSRENEICETFFKFYKENSERLLDKLEKEINSLNEGNLQNSQSSGIFSTFEDCISPSLNISENNEFSSMFNKNRANLKIVNRIITFLSDKKEQEQVANRKNKKEDSRIKKFLLNSFHCMGIYSAEINEEPVFKENFIKEILLEIPELESCKILISTIEEIFKDLELDFNLLAKFKGFNNNYSNTNQINDNIQIHKKTFFDYFKNKNSNQVQPGLSSQNTNPHSHLPNNSRRKTSFDLSESSIEKYKEEKNNFTIDKYFKPVDKKLSFNNFNFFEKKKEFNSHNNISSNNNPLTHNIITSSIIQKFREHSNNNSNHIINNNINTFSNSLKDYENFKTRNSAKSCHSEEIERMSVNSNSKKNSFIMDNATQNSNLFNTEFSKISHESNLRRINLSNTVSTPCHGYNSYNPLISSGKSTIFSQNSLAVSQFSLNPNLMNNNAMRSYRYQTPGENSSHMSDVSNNTSNFLGSSLNFSNSLIKQSSRRMGINSLLANKIRSIPKTRKNSEVNFKTFPSNTSSSKKRKKEKFLFLQKLYEKCGKNSNMKSNEKNKQKKTPNEKDKKLKKIIESNFYDRQNYLIKSPDVKEKKLSDKKTRESTQKNKEKLSAEEIIMENNENADQNKMLANKRQPENEIKRRTTRALAKKQDEQAQTKRTLTRSADKSMTDDEVLVYQTPIKINGIISVTDLKGSPGITTRKNLFNLFKQIDKSG